MSDRERQETIGQWLSDYRNVLYKIIRAYAFTTPDRDDLFQEIATQLWLSLDSFRGEAKPSTWIYRVALFTAIAWSKRERPHREGRDTLESVSAFLTDGTEVEDTRLTWLYEQIKQLEPIDRSLILLQLDGFSYEEISSMLGISESNVGVKLHRIKKRLTEKLQEDRHDGLQ